MTTKRLFKNACRGRRLRGRGPRLSHAGAGGPFPDFSFATLLHGAVTNTYRGRLFIEKRSRVRHTIKTSRKLAPGDCHVAESRLRLRLKVLRASSVKELDDLTLVRRDVSFQFGIEIIV